MKKYIMVFFTLCFILTGCKGSRYERDTSAGKLENIQLADVYKKYENKESFILLLTMTTCAHCHDLLEVLEPYLEKHNVVVYDLVLDKQGMNDETSYNAMTDRLASMLNGYEGTPTFAYIENGVLKDQIIGYAKKDGIKAYDELIQKYRLDEVDSTTK